MPTPVRRALCALTVLFVVAVGAGRLAAQPALMVYDWHLGLAPAEAVEHLRGLGFSGLVTRVKDPADVTKLADYAGHVAGLDDFRLMAYVAYDFSNPQSPGVWRDALPILAEVGAPLWVVVKQAPSELAIQQLLLEMARAADAVGLRAVVYPHWNTSVETADEAAALIAAVGHPNLRNSLHTCHEIRGGHQDDLPGVVAAHVDETALVAIAGAKQDAYAGPPNPLIQWGDVIKPLDKGDFSLLPFLLALHTAGYDGPVILQTYGIMNDPGHLRRSLRAYAGYVAELERRAG